MCIRDRFTVSLTPRNAKEAELLNTMQRRPGINVFSVITQGFTRFLTDLASQTTPVNILTDIFRNVACRRSFARVYQLRLCLLYTSTFMHWLCARLAGAKCGSVMTRQKVRKTATAPDAWWWHRQPCRAASFAFLSVTSGAGWTSVPRRTPSKN